MEQTNTTARESSDRVGGSRELTRPLEGRMIAGVAKGVAENFGISDWIPRVFFVVTAFIGGLGIALYAAGWAFIRSEDESESPAETFFRGASGSRAWLGIALIVIAGMIILSEFTILASEVIWAAALLGVGLLLYLGYIPGRRKTDEQPVDQSKEGVQQMTKTDIETTKELVDTPSGDSPAGGAPTPPPTPTPASPPAPPAKPRERSMLGRITLGVIAVGLGVLAILDNVSTTIDPEPYHYLALAVTILGVGLLVGGFVGRARWLILVGLIAIPPLVFSPFWHYDWDERTFDIDSTPLTFEQVATEYHQDIGRVAIDLTELPWDGQEVVVDVSVDAGSIEITIPEGVGIVGSASVNIGRVGTPGRESAGLGNPSIDLNQIGEDGTVLLDAHVNVGNIEIEREFGG